MTLQQKIDEHFNTMWIADDFVEAYGQAKGVDIYRLPPEDIRKTVKELEMKLEPEVLEGLKEAIIESVNERIREAMEDLV